jgi:hypothetical protein
MWMRLMMRGRIACVPSVGHAMVRFGISCISAMGLLLALYPRGGLPHVPQSNEMGHMRIDVSAFKRVSLHVCDLANGQCTWVAPLTKTHSRRVLG